MAKRTSEVRPGKWRTPTYTTRGPSDVCHRGVVVSCYSLPSRLSSPPSTSPISVTVTPVSGDRDPPRQSHVSGSTDLVTPRSGPRFSSDSITHMNMRYPSNLFTESYTDYRHTHYSLLRPFRPGYPKGRTMFGSDHPWDFLLFGQPNRFF